MPYAYTTGWSLDIRWHNLYIPCLQSFLIIQILDAQLALAGDDERKPNDIIL